MIELVIAPALLAILFLIAVFSRRVNIYLLYFQQEEYNNSRFISWIFKYRFFDTKITLLLVVQASLLMISNSGWLALSVFCAILVIAYFLVCKEPNPAKSKLVKKKLVITERVRKIKLVSFIIVIVLVVVGTTIASTFTKHTCIGLIPFTITTFIVVQAIPFVIVLANFMLSRNEKKNQQMFLGNAQYIYKKIAPYTIGITGSYGKTSTKMLLADILNQTLGPTFTPVASINTLMGITAYIRKNLRVFHKYSIIEMGAYNVGSIKRLCDLTPPDAAIVTSVGIMHLERYGSREQVFYAKSELPEALNSQGVLVCNGDDEYCREMVKNSKAEKVYLYGYDNSANDLDAYITNLRFDNNGSHFVINFRGGQYPASCKVFGKPLISNVLASFTMACALGAAPEHVAAVIQTLETYDNRLQLEATSWNGKKVVLLKDAYNSNPVGFKAALEILDGIEGERKVLITPGMVELGDEQYNSNKGAAKEAAKVCNRAYIVGNTNKMAFVEGLTEQGFKREHLFETIDMKEALLKARQNAEDGDVILIENDLPDLYEKLINI